MTSQDWPEISVCATPATAEALEEWLFAAGAVSVTYKDSHDQPILEPAPGEIPLWDEITLVGLFAQATSIDDLHSSLHLAAIDNSLSVPDYALNILQDTVWERTWMADYQPMQFGPHFWVCPSHCVFPDEQAINLKLDPGLAFGTGTHPTTAQCLQWLGEKTGASLQPLAGKTVIDFGCGSGVLAIAALLLGAGSAYAVDIDKQAILASCQNADINGVSKKLHTGYANELQLPCADITMANILFEPLTTLAERFAAVTSSGGQLVMSGILEHQVEPLCMRYNPWFDFHPVSAYNGWALLTATRRPE